MRVLFQRGSPYFLWQLLLLEGMGAHTDPTPRSYISLRSISPQHGFPQVQAVALRPEEATTSWLNTTQPPHINSSVYPVVLMHGMGDAADNPGMQSLRKAIAARLNTTVINIAIGDSQMEDTRNGFFMNLDDQVSIFAAKIHALPILSQGFNVMGFSQGNLILRGYIERDNTPPVRTFISVHGPMMGVGALPKCTPTGWMCQSINKMIATAAYTPSVQAHLAQANYYRDPFRLADYRHHALFLPDINQEVPTHRPNRTYAAHFSDLTCLVLIKATHDTMIYPSESEWFGTFQNGSYDIVVTMENTLAYRTDAFGLRTLHEAGRVVRRTTAGDHLQFSDAELYEWVDQYFKTTITAHVAATSRVMDVAEPPLSLRHPPTKPHVSSVQRVE